MSPVNVCILGCGAIAKLHSHIARTLRSQVRLSYASRSLEKAIAYNKRFRGTGAFGSYEEACRSPDVDAVFICTPHAFHVAHVRLAAANHKAILLEKPVCRTLDELTEIETATVDAGVVCMVAENYFFKPVARALRRHLERGDIGKPVFIEINKTGRSRTSGWRADPELMGGGALLEGGVHWVNLLLGIGGDVTEVLATKPDVPQPATAPFEDSLQVLVKFRSGAVGKLLHSWNILNRIGGLSTSRVYGTDGNIIFESNGLWALIIGNRRRIRVPGLLDIMGYRAMLRAFATCVREHRAPEMSLQVARRDLRVVFAAYASLASGRFEAV
jgi:predicted dehydrogenase